MKIWFSVLLNILFIHSSFAQSRKEQISFSTEIAFLKRNPTPPLIRTGVIQTSLSYQQQFRHYYLTICFSQWGTGADKNPWIVVEDGAFHPYSYYLNPTTIFTPKYFLARVNYKFLELGIGKAIHYKKNELTLFISASFGFGSNVYNEYLVYTWNPWESHVTSNYGSTKNHYWGYSGKLHYNYFLIKDRLNVGAQIGFKYLFKYDHTQIELGLKTGYNFDWKKKK